jgi:hypothetical protein
MIPVNVILDHVEKQGIAVRSLPLVRDFPTSASRGESVVVYRADGETDQMLLDRFCRVLALKVGSSRVIALGSLTDERVQSMSVPMYSTSVREHFTASLSECANYITVITMFLFVED